MISVTKLIKLYHIPILGGVARKLCYILGIDISRKVQIGENCSFPHNSIGTVIHDSTIIENNVKIYQNVTLGRADVYKTGVNQESRFEGFHICEGVCLCAGAKIICKEGILTIGKNSVVAANAVLLNSIGENEIWGGIPARLLGYRTDIKNDE